MTLYIKHQPNWSQQNPSLRLKHIHSSPQDKMAVISQMIFFICIFVNENICILIQISLKFVPNGQNNKILALVWLMAFHRPGNKPLFEPMKVSLPMHICITWPQWVNVHMSGLVCCYQNVVITAVESFNNILKYALGILYVKYFIHESKTYIWLTKGSLTYSTIGCDHCGYWWTL